VCGCFAPTGTWLVPHAHRPPIRGRWTPFVNDGAISLRPERACIRTVYAGPYVALHAQKLPRVQTKTFWLTPLGTSLIYVSSVNYLFLSESPQSLLLSSPFTYHLIDCCPHLSLPHRRATCESHCGLAVLSAIVLIRLPCCPSGRAPKVVRET
jgi:hypothetical protein